MRFNKFLIRFVDGINRFAKRKRHIINSLATGLRASNVTGLQWAEIDSEKRHAWIHPDEAKMKKTIPVPLNDNALDVLHAR